MSLEQKIFNILTTDLKLDENQSNESTTNPDVTLPNLDQNQMAELLINKVMGEIKNREIYEKNLPSVEADFDQKEMAKKLVENKQINVNEIFKKFFKIK